MRRIEIFSGVMVLAFIASPTTVSAKPKGHAAAPAIVDSTGKSPAEREAEGWKITRPPYPPAARLRKEQGSMWVEIITGKDGRVVKASVPKSKDHPILDVCTAKWAYAQWHGPPNHRLVVPVTYTVAR